VFFSLIQETGFSLLCGCAADYAAIHYIAENCSDCP